MEIGYFTMPSHPPECGLKEGQEWDLQVLRWLDELGYQEAWIGEHHTAPWEPHPAPDLILAQAFRETKNIRLGPGGFLLPYHHPAELANRVAMLDHLSDGRLNFGIAASGLPSDWAMFNVDGMSGQNREMTREALEIILRLWSEPAPFTHKGKYWTVTKPEVMFDFLKPHIKPVQAPHPPIVIITSNRTREIHDALKRRCLYHWVDYPSAERELAIVKTRLPGISQRLSQQIVRFVQALRDQDFYKSPGVAETLDWATALTELDARSLNAEVVGDTLGALLKYQDDITRMQGDQLQKVIKDATSET